MPAALLGLSPSWRAGWTAPKAGCTLVARLRAWLCRDDRAFDHEPRAFKAPADCGNPIPARRPGCARRTCHEHHPSCLSTDWRRARRFFSGTRPDVEQLLRCVRVRAASRRTLLRSLRPQMARAGRSCSLCRRQRPLCPRRHPARADPRPRRPGARGLRRRRAVARHRTRPVRRRGARACSRADHDRDGGCAGLSPLLGSALDGLFGWRITFLVVAAFGVVLALHYSTSAGETHPADRRASLAASAVASAYGRLAVDPRFLLPAVSVSLVIGG